MFLLVLCCWCAAAHAEADDASRRPLRIAVYDLTVADVEPRVAHVFVDSFLAELRKLQRVSVLSLDDVKALLDLEAQKQLAGCDDSSCLAEIAEALGADVLIVGGFVKVDGTTAMSLKRIDARAAVVVRDYTQQIVAANGDELLAAIGPIVEKLFDDVPLRAGERRGVAKEVALRLNPPPVPPAVWYAAASTTAVGLAASAVAGVFWSRADSNLRTSIELAKSSPQPGRLLLAQQSDVVTANAVFWGIAGTTGAVAIVTAVLVPFTDFQNIGAQP